MDASQIKLNYKDNGLLPAVVQDVKTGEVLMLGYMNEEAFRRTMASGEVWFWSRSRKELWHKGETSGNFLKVREVWKDCDSDTILVKAHPMGPTCHTGNKTCFFEKLEPIKPEKKAKKKAKITKK